MYCWNHPKVRENWKTVCAAVVLLLVGVGLLGMGVFAVAEPENGLQGAVFFVAGLICFVPGAYHVVYIWQAARGQRGYDFYHLPLFTWFHYHLSYHYNRRRRCTVNYARRIIINLCAVLQICSLKWSCPKVVERAKRFFRYNKLLNILRLSYNFCSGAVRLRPSKSKANWMALSNYNLIIIWSNHFINWKKILYITIMHMSHVRKQIVTHKYALNKI